MRHKSAWPKMSGANPAIKAPAQPSDTRLHRRVVVCYGDSIQDGFEVWTACGLETTGHGAQTTRTAGAVTCERCKAA
jgi:hypothetical protein